MVTQVTISPSFQKKMTKFHELYGDAIEDKLTSLGLYAVQISPVDTGAFVESWSLRPIGSSSGRRRQREGKPSKDTTIAKEDARQNILSDAATYKDQIIKQGGAILVNRSSDAKEVDEKFMTVQRVRDRFR